MIKKKKNTVKKDNQELELSHYLNFHSRYVEMYFTMVVDGIELKNYIDNENYNDLLEKTYSFYMEGLPVHRIGDEKIRFKDRLKRLQKERKDFVLGRSNVHIGHYEIELVDKWVKFLSDKLKEIKNNEKSQPKIKFEMIFAKTSHFNYIMELLVKNNLCQAGTYIWKDEAPGSKGLLVAILKFLHLQGYYKENKKLKHQEIKEVAQNTFGISIGIDTIKRTPPSSIHMTFSIPLASTVK